MIATLVIGTCQRKFRTLCLVTASDMIRKLLFYYENYLLLLLDDQHDQDVGEALRKMCQISLPQINCFGYFPLGIDSASLCYMRNWMIQLYQEQGTNKTFYV